MGFWNLFNKSLKEYRTNFRSIFSFLLIFKFLPALVWIIGLFLLGYWNTDALTSLLIPGSQFNGSPFFLAIFLVGASLYSLISLALYLFVCTGLTKLSLEKKTFRYKDLVAGAEGSYFKYLGLFFINILFLIGLFLLLIVPGIIFWVYWIFAYCILYDQKAGIRESLKKSRLLVKGRWWKVFGYFLLSVLLVGFVSWGISLISSPLSFYSLSVIAHGETLSLGYYSLISLATSILNFVNLLLTVPIWIIFLKNMYFELKAKKF